MDIDDYKITLTDLNPTSPAAVQASKNIRKFNNIAVVGGSFTYSLSQ